jgi:hypothetical protein
LFQAEARPILRETGPLPGDEIETIGLNLDSQSYRFAHIVQATGDIT